MSHLVQSRLQRPAATGYWFLGGGGHNVSAEGCKGLTLQQLKASWRKSDGQSPTMCWKVW